MLWSRQIARLLGRRAALVRGAAAAAGLMMLLTGAGGGFDNLLRLARDDLRMRPASGEVVIVEIDGRSLREIDQWPWPRRHHAALIDWLYAAQARVIAFDVDFSARSNPADDAAMAAALDRAGGEVVLPTLRQTASRQSSDQLETVPTEAFRNNAFLAGVNVVPDADGYVRHIPLGTFTAGAPRPSLAAMVAEQEGGVDAMLEIDFAIDPATIPHFSFADVIAGRVDPAAFRNRRVLIGATSIDLGDRYAVPLHGVVPGVVIQALAAETLLTGRVPGAASGVWPLMLALGGLHLALRRRRRGVQAVLFGASGLVVLGLPLLTEDLFAISFPLAPALAAMATAVAVAAGLHLAERFRQRTFTDAGTGLPNLAAFEAAIAQAEPGAVFVARIDRFAELAAGLGPDATVRLVQRVVDRLSFDGGRIVHRIDEGSLAWLEPAEDRPLLEQRLASLTALMRPPVDCGRMIDVLLGFGVALPDGSAAAQQIANGSLAAVQATRLQRRWEFFVAAGAEEIDWRMSLLGELDAAMAAGEVWNAYQPKYDIASGRITGVETLVRWRHPTRGAVGPDSFIPLVEEHGRAADLTAFVFKQALADAARWHAAGHELAVAVNVSATLLDDDVFILWLRETMRNAAVAPALITIEVTESAAMNDPAAAAKALHEWRKLGVGISIDDYGTGQSSLGYLQQLPAVELKIDKSFILTVAEDSRNAIMVRSTVALAHQLGMKVVAEGVETAAALAVLSEMGCDTAQGWLIGRPMAAAALEAFLEQPLALAA